MLGEPHQCLRCTTTTVFKMNHTTGPRNLALPALLLHASAARVESKNLEIRLVEIWGRVCGKMIVEEQYESSRHSANLITPPLCFKYILLYIPGRGLLHDMGTLHLLHPRCCDRSLRGKGVGMAASSCGTPQLKCQVFFFRPTPSWLPPGRSPCLGACCKL